jgi:acetylornithine deacetylase/succinyl-diaminopimelate desuccinylase-like protein
MSSICLEEAQRILADLIALPSVNPMGRPYTADEPVERKVADYIDEFFRPYKIETERQACSPIHESLLIKVPGKVKEAYTLLEAHMDTVPADDWAETAFTPRVRGTVMYGRGACDDKGPLTAMILAVRDVLESGTAPTFPIAFLAAGDEEYSQKGIKYFAGQNLPLGRAVVAEATGMVPILQHNGTMRWDITVHGRSAHTSRPELGCNAILGAVDVIHAIARHQRDLRSRLSNPWMQGPTLTITMIHGGRTRNAVPDLCTLAVDFRVLPGMDPFTARQDVIEMLKTTGHEISHGEVQLMTPPLATDADNIFSSTVLDICRRGSGKNDMAFTGAPWGTDAAWVADRAPALVLGPGTTESAHAVDEHIDIRDVVNGAGIYRDILMSEF